MKTILFIIAVLIGTFSISQTITQPLQSKQLWKNSKPNYVNVTMYPSASDTMYDVTFQDMNYTSISVLGSLQFHNRKSFQAFLDLCEKVISENVEVSHVDDNGKHYLITKSIAILNRDYSKQVESARIHLLDEPGNFYNCGLAIDGIKILRE